MKKFLKPVILIVIAVIALTLVFTACDTSAKAYTVTFTAEGKVVKTVQTKGNEVIAVPEAPEKEGYEFAGWYLDRWQWQKPFDGNNFASVPLTSDVKVYAYYTEIKQEENKKYDIAFIADGKVVDTVNTAGNETVPLPTAPDKTDYEFEGWYLDENVWSQPFTADYYADKALTQNISVYAYYVYVPPVIPAPDKYDITFYAFGEVIDTVNTAGNETVSLPTAPDKTDYEFKGWYLDENVWSQPFTADYYAEKALTDDINVYAYYEYSPTVDPEPQKYDITFYAFGEVAGTVNTAGNEIITLPTAPVKDNYEFKGWYFDENVWTRQLTADSYAHTALTESVSVYAYYVYVPPVYTVNFDTDEGSEVESVTVSVIEKEPVTAKDGYDFDGWYLDPQKTERVTFPYTVTHSCTLYAKWIEKGVTFTLDSSNMISSVSNVPADGRITIPATVNGVKVSGIASYAFRWNSDLVSVEVDPSITNFGVGVFWGCGNLSYVSISDAVTALPSNMFTECRSLKSIELPKALRKIEYDVFMGSGLESVTLPEGVTDIWQFAFKDCKNLVSVDLGNVARLSQGVFQNCPLLTRIVIPDTIREIEGNYMFSGCTSLSEIVFPDVAVPLNYNFVHETAYYNDAKNWENDALYVGNHLVTVKNELKNATSFVVREGTLTVARLAFYEAGYYSNAKLTSLTLPEGLKVIGERAFENCTMLKNVNMPDSVIRIGSGAIPSTALSADGYVGNWLVKYNLSGTTVTAKEGTVGIADGNVTNSQDKVTEVILPSTLKYIGSENFRNMTSLTTVNAPAGLVSIGDSAFNNCKKLEMFDLSGCDSLVSIGETAFSWCESLKTLYIPSGVAFVGEMAFNQMAAVTLHIARSEDDIPAGWNYNWNYTFASTPLNIVWNA